MLFFKYRTCESNIYHMPCYLFNNTAAVIF